MCLPAAGQRTGSRVVTLQVKGYDTVFGAPTGRRAAKAHWLVRDRHHVLDRDGNPGQRQVATIRPSIDLGCLSVRALASLTRTNVPIC